MMEGPGNVGGEEGGVGRRLIMPGLFSLTMRIQLTGCFHLQHLCNSTVCLGPKNTP